MATIISSRRASAANTTVGTDPAQSRQTFPHPVAANGLALDRQAFYEQMFQYYSNTAFDDMTQWAKYKRKYNLYRYTRGVFNPFTRLVDFYADHVYPGVLSIDPDLPNGIQSAIPMSHNVPQPLREAVAQTWDWANWQVHKGTMVTFGGMTGNTLVEVVDDLPGRNVRYKVWWPGFVKDFILDAFGNLDSYILEYQAADSDGVYTYTKSVDRGVIETFKDGHRVSIQANPYPFVPAVWSKHVDLGSDFGLNCMRGGQPKFDELNSVASHTFDHIHKQINSPRILWSKDQIKSLFRDNRNATEDDFDPRNEVLMLKGAEGGHTETLVGNLDPATIVPLVKELIQEIESDYPELVAWKWLRQQSIVTGPGARQQMGDVESALQKPASNYDAASIRLFRMGVAIAGWRVNEGHWGPKDKLTLQQAKFLPFDFSSYNAGQLDISILPRPLISDSSADVASEMQQRTQAVASVQNILPLEEQYKMLGYRADEIPDMVRRFKEQQKEAQQMAIETALASKPAPAQQGGSSK